MTTKQGMRYVRMGVECPKCEQMTDRRLRIGQRGSVCPSCKKSTPLTETIQLRLRETPELFPEIVRALAYEL